MPRRQHLSICALTLQLFCLSGYWRGFPSLKFYQRENIKRYQLCVYSTTQKRTEQETPRL